MDKLKSLLRDLEAPSWSLRVLAANRLGDLGDPRAVTALEQALFADDTAVTRAAAEALFKLETPAAAETLLKAFAGDLHDADVAEEVQSVLAARPDWFVEACVEALRSHPDPHVRGAAAGALAFPLWADQALPALRRAASDQAALVRDSAARAVQWLESTSKGIGS